MISFLAPFAQAELVEKEPRKVKAFFGSLLPAFHLFEFVVLASGAEQELRQK